MKIFEFKDEYQIKNLSTKCQMHTPLQAWSKCIRPPWLRSDHSVLTASRALGLPHLLNSMWKHNERMTELTTLTSRLLHQCFHPLAFSFSTHHFPLLCNWETTTTSESRGWSYMKGGRGMQTNAHVVGHVSGSYSETLPQSLFWGPNYFVHSSALLAHSTLALRVSLSLSESIIISPFISLCQPSRCAHAQTHVLCPPSQPPESRLSLRSPRPRLTKTTV